MRKGMLAAVLTVAMSSASASTSYESQITNILEDVSSTNRMVRLNAVNRIDALMASLSDREEIAACKLLKAKLRIECADVMGEESIYDYYAYHDATNLCWGVLNDFRADRSKWQFYGASLLLPRPLSMDKRYGDMFSVATNALSALDEQGMMPVATNVWTVLLSQELLHPCNVRDTLRMLAASSLLLSDANANVSSYTNGLPVEALAIVNAIRSR